jgi:hydrogenase-4 component B
MMNRDAKAPPASDSLGSSFERSRNPVGDRPIQASRNLRWCSVNFLPRAPVTPDATPAGGDTVPPVSDPVLLFLTADSVALLLVGASAMVMPLATCCLLTAALSGLGALLCLPPLFLRLQATSFAIPIGPPGLSLHFVLDPLSLLFLIIVFLSGTAIAAFQATPGSRPHLESVRATTFCLAGTGLSLLAADAVVLALGLATTCAATGRNVPRILPPFLVLAAVCLLTPAGYAPRFDAIRAAPSDPTHATAAAALTIAAAAGLLWPAPRERCWARDALIPGVLIPLGSYLLLRLIADLSANAAQVWWGLILLLAGGAVAVIQGWRSVALPDIDILIGALMQRQAGLAMASIGLALVARGADLPAAAAFAFEAACLTAVGASLAGTLTLLSAHSIGASAGTYRLSRLGGLVHSMPGSSAALAAGLLTLSALPPSLGFAALWLSLQSIISAPRFGGLPSQLPLALLAAAIALSAALATAGSVRIVGIAILGRPRTPQGAGAAESPSPIRTILLTLAGLSLVAGVLPGPLLQLLADPAIHALTGLPSSRGLPLLSVFGSSPGYLALPVFAVLGLAIGVAILLPRRSRKHAKTAGPWMEGMQPPVGLPFGDPAAQSVGAGFLPALPDITLPRLPPLPAFPRRRLPTATAGLWLILAAFGLLLLVLAATQ